MYEVARLLDFEPGPEGTELRLLVPHVNLMEPIVTKEITECGIWLDDGRQISAAQRKKIFAMFNDIAEWTGYSPKETHERMKYEYIKETGGPEFSLSDCSMEIARDFINFLLDLALKYGMWLSDSGINRTDDINKYLYSCLKHKRCCVCGRDGETHHEDAIGMGNNRKKVDDSKLRKICLCRTEHTEEHTIGMASFSKKYKVYGIIFND